MPPIQPLPQPGEIEELTPGLRRILAANPSPYTGPGTFTHILGQDRLVVIDPGPDLPDHRAALLRAVAGARVEAILVSHAHLDHSEAVPHLAAMTGAEVIGFGPAGSGRSAAMRALANLGGGEGLDTGFAPDRQLQAGWLDCAAGGIEVFYSPGHSAEHLTFAWEGHLFPGDNVMGWSSSIVSPPDGDMGAYMTSLNHLASRSEAIWHPSHGAALAEPQTRLAELIAHRRAREITIGTALAEAQDPVTIADLLPRIYPGLAPALHPAAARNLLAHLLDLAQRGLATAHPTPGPDALWRAG